MILRGNPGTLVLRLTALFMALPFCSACANRNSSAPPAESAKETHSQASPSGEEDISAEEAELLAQIEGEAELAEASAVSQKEDPSGGREIVYRVSPDGMRVLIGDAEFVPYAVSFRTGSGFGVRLTVEVKTTSEMILFAPTQGPLAFGGVVQRREPQKFGDKREGGGEIVLTPGSPATFSRTWPAPGQAPLLAGETLELQVGLWGLGHGSEDRRPVNRFVVVKMKATPQGAQPRVEPPGQ